MCNAQFILSSTAKCGLRLLLLYLLVFSLPVVAATVLFYANLPLRVQAHEVSAEWLNLALSPDANHRERALEEIFNSEHRTVFRWLDSLAIGTILLISAACALAIPPTLSSEKKLNLLTFMVIGLCAANLIIGFGFLNWLEFGLGSGFITRT